MVAAEDGGEREQRREPDGEPYADVRNVCPVRRALAPPWGRRGVRLLPARKNPKRAAANTISGNGTAKKKMATNDDAGDGPMLPGISARASRSAAVPRSRSQARPP